MGSHIVTCHPAEVRIPPLPPAEAGTRFSDPGWMQGWVDLCYVKATGRELNPWPVNRKSNTLPLMVLVIHPKRVPLVSMNIRQSGTVCRCWTLYSYISLPGVGVSLSDCLWLVSVLQWLCTWISSSSANAAASASGICNYLRLLTSTFGLMLSKALQALFYS